MANDVYEGPDRRARPSQQDLIETARRAALEVLHVARRERINTVVLSVLCSLLMACIVALPVTFLLNKQSQHQAHLDAQATCGSVASTRGQGNDRALVEQVILQVADQAFTSFPPQFQREEIVRINALIAVARQKFPGVVDVHPIRRFGDLVGYVALLDALSCT